MDNENSTEPIEQNSDLANTGPDSLEPIEVNVSKSSEDAKMQDDEVNPLRRLSRREYLQLTFGAYMALLPALLAILAVFALMYIIVRFVW